MTLAMGAIATSCADEFDQSFSVSGMPENMAQYEYLKAYAPLREYVGQGSSFRLGAALAASDFNDGGVVYQLAASNFHEIVAGNAMKMASCVDSKTGAMSFSTVSSFVSSAAAAGLTVYGHTLAWHAQQPKEWLEGTLLADIPVPVDPDGMKREVVKEQTYTDGPFPFYVMGCEPPVIDGAIHFEPTGAWSQFFCCTGTSLSKGNYGVVLNIQSSKEGSIKLTCQNGWGGDAQNVTLTVPLVEGWSEPEIKIPEEIVGGNYDFILKPETFDAVLDLKSVTVVQYKSAGPATYFVDLIENGDCEGSGNTNFVVRKYQQSDVNATFTDGDGRDGSKGIRFEASAKAENEWDNQFFIYAPDEVLNLTDKIHFSMDVRADKPASIPTQAHAAPGGYKHYAFVGNVEFTTEWTTHEFTGLVTADGVSSIALNLNALADANTYYFDNIVWQVERESTSGGIPQTAEQKKDTLTYAMNRWIAGMMQACDGKVKAWDAVNEAIAGSDRDGDGWYDLQHASTANNDNGVSADFFWQDYLGDIDYVRTVISSARRNYKALGGEGELTLFINDYNLESTWDDNMKLKSLIHWVGLWECDTIRIDGLGTQMHISYNENEAAQKKQEECIVNMFRLMAETGKLVRVSELDMGYVDAAGNSVMTEDMTEQQHRNMADFYRFIVSKYFEIVPAAQQYGITQWCLTDAPADSGWRKGQPVGLWDLNYNRKHTYAGFADGLKAGRK